MRQKFFTDTIQSRFIKALLYNTPLPCYDSVSGGEYIIKGCYYIYKSSVIKCLESGTFLTDSQWEKVLDYHFGEYYPQFTERFVSKYNYYDSDTHKWLGKYLRFYRDIYDIDLMPFYNCFSGEYYEGVKINRNGVTETSNLHKTFKVAKIPIRFNTTYTIAIDCLASVYVAPAIIANGALVNVPMSEDEGDLTSVLNSYEGNIKRFDSMSFREPKTYIVNNNHRASEDFFHKYEKDLYMLIQIPADNNSSIVVLEGDYTDLETYNVFSVDMMDSLDTKVINSLVLSELSLLKFSDKTRYPFSDRLVEYLLANVITENDEIGNNIKWVQSFLNTIPGAKLSGVWERASRKELFDKYYKNNKYPNIDINGFVDKDVEKMLLGGNSYGK